jgi:hypothetical protein
MERSVVDLLMTTLDLAFSTEMLVPSSVGFNTHSIVNSVELLAVDKVTLFSSACEWSFNLRLNFFRSLQGLIPNKFFQLRVLSEEETVHF